MILSACLKYWDNFNIELYIKILTIKNQIK
jgi:hypothetical protein